MFARILMASLALCACGDADVGLNTTDTDADDLSEPCYPDSEVSCTTEGLDSGGSRGTAEIVGSWSSGIWYRDVATSQWVQMWSNTAPGGMAAGDFTGDGKADVASIWDQGIWHQDGVSLEWTKISDTPPRDVTAGDVNGDGRFEVIGTWNNGSRCTPRPRPETATISLLEISPVTAKRMSHQSGPVVCGIRTAFLWSGPRSRAQLLKGLQPVM
ncbi:FG-GAP repeat domain-containing protein [Myxococcota bacterium]